MTPTLNSAELLPCPFCGGEALLGGTVDTDIVHCKECEATMVTDIGAAPPMWNTRQAAEMVTRLESAGWQPIETAPMGESGDASTYFIGARQDGARINTKTCYRNKHGAYEWWGGGLEPTHWMPLMPLPPAPQPAPADEATSVANTESER